MSRVSNWEELWTNFMMKARDSAFTWGEDDCMLLAGENVKVLTGQDLFSEHRGKYSTEKEALAYLKSLGYTRPEDMVDAFLDEIPVPFAQRGDIVLHQGSLGICMADLSLFKGEEKTELVRTLDCDRAWKVDF
jgi:hypothetical protein